jgi:hypothetical protein
MRLQGLHVLPTTPPVPFHKLRSNSELSLCLSCLRLVLQRQVLLFQPAGAVDTLWVQQSPQSGLLLLATNVAPACHVCCCPLCPAHEFLPRASLARVHVLDS